MNTLSIIALVLLILICFIVIVLYLGIRITLKYEKEGLNISGTFKILFLNKITVFSIEYPSDEKEDKAEKKEEEKKDENKEVLIKYLLKESRPILKPLKNLIIKLLKTIKVHSLENHIKLGLASFADTGEYIGYLWAILTIPNTLIKPCALSAEPVFGEPTLDGHGDIDIRINLLKAIVPVISFLLVKDVRNFIKGFIKLKKEAKDEKKN